VAEIALNKMIEAELPMSEDIIKDALKRILKTKFSKFKFRKNSPGAFVAQIKTRLFYPIVVLKGDIQTQIQGTKAKIMITATTKTNAWFWFLALTALVFTFGICLLLMLWIYSTQKNASVEAFKQSFEQLEFELGKI